MNKRTYMLSVFAVLNAVMFSQDFHYAAVFDAVGQVKEIKTDSGNPIVRKKVKINKNGKSGMPVMMYDEAGFPIGFEMNMLGKQTYQKFFWDKNKRLDSVAIKLDMIGNSELITVKNNYTGNTVESQILEVKMKDCNKRYVRVFSDYSNDEEGNWISRNVRQTLIENDCLEIEEEFTETRTIKYYNRK